MVYLMIPTTLNLRILCKTILRALLVTIAILQILNVQAFTCIDDNGNPTDWWVILKAAPYSSAYFIYSDTLKSFELSPYNVNQTTKGAIMETVNQLYALKNLTATNLLLQIAYFLYNDEPPPDSTASSSFAHAKGMLLTNATAGFYIDHSMPHWPNAYANGPGPFPDFTYGQSLICVSVSAKTANTIAGNLLIEHPYLYDKFISNTLISKLPNIDSLINNKSKPSALSNATIFKSLGGRTFYQIAKSPSLRKDFWDDLVAPYFGTPLNVETWRNGAGGRIGSVCGTGGEKVEAYPTYEVAKVSITVNSKVNYTWTGTQDHSKWACAARSSHEATDDGTSTGDDDNNQYYYGNYTNKPSVKAASAADFAEFLSAGGYTSSISSYVACVGDLNRMCSQETRGGGAICLIDSGLWNAFNRSVAALEGCWQYDPCLGSSTQCYWCPSKAPTKLPTLHPMLSTFAPTINPATTSAVPTSTLEQPAESLTFTSELHLVNATLSGLTASCQTALAVTTAEAMSIPTNYVTYVSAVQPTVSHTGVREGFISINTATKLPSLVATLRTIVPLTAGSPFASQANNPNGLYNQLTLALATQVQTQSFSQLLRANSKRMGAMDTAYANVSSVSESAPIITAGVSSSSSGSAPGLSAGIMVAIVISAVFVVAACFFAVYLRMLILKRRQAVFSDQERAISTNGINFEKTSRNPSTTSNPIFITSELRFTLNENSDQGLLTSSPSKPRSGSDL